MEAGVSKMTIFLRSRGDERADPLHLDQVAETCSISVRDLTVNADIGIYPGEIGQPQPLIVSVSLEVCPPTEDRIDQAFDYVNIVMMAQALAAKRIALIETYARELASGCLEHSLVIAATVSIEKPNALPDAVAGCRVSLTRETRLAALSQLRR